MPSVALDAVYILDIDVDIAVEVVFEEGIDARML
jgi:hypothetical protein